MVCSWITALSGLWSACVYECVRVCVQTVTDNGLSVLSLHHNLWHAFGKSSKLNKVSEYIIPVFIYHKNINITLRDIQLYRAKHALLPELTKNDSIVEKIIIFQRVLTSLKGFNLLQKCYMSTSSGHGNNWKPLLSPHPSSAGYDTSVVCFYNVVVTESGHD